jgi:hypothetical protein
MTPMFGNGGLVLGNILPKLCMIYFGKDPCDLALGGEFGNHWHRVNVAFFLWLVDSR